MSPEQVTGRLKIDRRTDIYSLGLALYELLCLAPPVAAPNIHRHLTIRPEHDAQEVLARTRAAAAFTPPKAA